MRERLMDFAIRFRAWRKFRGLTQVELALRVDSAQYHVSSYETGRSEPTPGVLADWIARGFETTEAEFWATPLEHLVPEASKAAVSDAA